MSRLKAPYSPRYGAFPFLSPEFSFSQPPLAKIMTIEISKESRQEALVSLQRYFKENMEDEIGSLTANGLLGFFLEEIGPLIYNKAVSDVQKQLQMRVMEVDAEVYEDEFQYWRKADRSKRKR